MTELFPVVLGKKTVSYIVASLQEGKLCVHDDERILSTYLEIL